MNKNNNNKITYTDNKIKLNKKIINKEEQLIFLKPNVEIDLSILDNEYEYVLEGNDIILKYSNGDSVRLVSMGLLLFDKNSNIKIKTSNGVVDGNSILDKIDMVNNTTNDMIFTSEDIIVENNIKATDEVKEVKNTIEEANVKVEKVITQEDEINPKLEEINNEQISELINNNTSTIENTVVETYTSNKTEDATLTTTKLKDANTEGAKPTLNFEIDFQHVYKDEIKEGTTLKVIGGGGIGYGNEYPESKDISELVKQGAQKIWIIQICIHLILKD